MRPLTTAELLDVWEHGSATPPAERALALLAAACPEFETETLSEFSVGRRDGLLLRLRDFTFGPRFTAIATCPKCNEQIEARFAADDIRYPDVRVEPAGITSVKIEGYDASFRLPDSRDLLAVASMTDAAAAVQALVARCVVAARIQNENVAAEHLPESVLNCIEEEMSKSDPQGAIEFSLDCPACSTSWIETFDILSFFWSELSAWAQRLLGEVHALASAYGWREADILEMTPARRSIYLGMLTD
jgi:hypothetical protein